MFGRRGNNDEVEALGGLDKLDQDRLHAGARVQKTGLTLNRLQALGAMLVAFTLGLFAASRSVGSGSQADYLIVLLEIAVVAAVITLGGTVFYALRQDKQIDAHATAELALVVAERKADAVKDLAAQTKTDEAQALLAGETRRLVSELESVRALVLTPAVVTTLNGRSLLAQLFTRR